MAKVTGTNLKSMLSFPQSHLDNSKYPLTHRADCLQYYGFFKLQGAAACAETEEQREKHTPVCKNIRVRRLPSKRSEFHN